MNRLFWTAVGAAGGILAYRKWEEVRDQAADEGLLPVAQQLSAQALSAVTTARGLLGKGVEGGTR